MSAPTTELDPYVCECGASLWCASMRHTLEDCEADCEFWTENPAEQSAWCCLESPGGECDNGKDCSELCGCKEAEGA